MLGWISLRSHSIIDCTPWKDRRRGSALNRTYTVDVYGGLDLVLRTQPRPLPPNSSSSHRSPAPVGRERLNHCRQAGSPTADILKFIKMVLRITQVVCWYLCTITWQMYIYTYNFRIDKRQFIGPNLRTHKKPISSCLSTTQTICNNSPFVATKMCQLYLFTLVSYWVHE